MPMSTRTTRSRIIRQPRKHSKTFTGCWTCRARKVKCDEARPKCRLCRSKGLHCEGYDVRLHWLTPETGLDDDRQGSPDTAYQSKSRRSQIAFGSPDPPLPCYQVDDILAAIDTLKPGRINNGNGGVSQFIRCFGVFDPSKRPLDEIEVSLQSPATGQSDVAHFDSTYSPPRSTDSESLSITNHTDVSQECTAITTLSIPSITTQDIPASDYLFIDPLLSDGATESLVPFDYMQQLGSIDLQANDFTVSLGNDDWEAALNASIPRCPSPAYLSSKEQFLMHHYVNRVVHLFCTLDNPKSPWKTIHLPRALQSAGELTIQGSTSKIRGALRSALISISAFCLSNDNKVQLREDESLKWASEAMFFRGSAIKLLKEAVESESLSKCRPKYKELLATMLSMISINVMSGDTASCGMHLDAAHELISHTKTWKIRYSNKAQALHRIYFFLRTIYESTAIRNNASEAKMCEPWIAGSSKTDGPANPLRGALEGEIDLTAPETSIRGGAYESIYAIPQSLLMLLSQATELINQVTDAREESRNSEIPKSLVERCDDLEKRIMDWHAESTPSNKSSSNSNIIQHMTRAFHNAIIIFFAQHIRLMGYRYLQTFVENVIESIEAVERIKAEAQILAAPIYWPAFIAASEAFDPNLQDRFRSWYNQVEIYGIECMRTGIRVLVDVWAEGPSRGTRTTSLWKVVAKRTGSSLMLT
ncbi:hypothetical protein FDECE_7199 [Fusarium decemcellulare]|nr:hypothetical protein FDECE_7199 [Fusarium decemcellulare]